ncbi:MAG: glucose 1-dehydrogenase [Alphaproteobacteria bacterium]|nr:glucose 1-dehydrogenase [Alphaproteobacteria bacterium]
MTKRFDGKVAFITGAASGIGLGAVELFVEDGARVIAADINAEQGAMIEQRFNGAVSFQKCDVTDVAQIKAAIDEGVRQFGGLDIVFNNAGAAGAMESIEEMDFAEWDRTHALLLRSVAAGTSFAIPHLKARGGGAIVNTSSVTAFNAGYGPIAYSTMKAAVKHFTTLAAAELAQHHIRVNAIAPGFIATSIFGSGMDLDSNAAKQMGAMLADKFGPMQPAGRAGRPRDIAEAAAYLASDAAGFVTGICLTVDGGILIGPRHAWDPNAASPMADAMGVSPEQLRQMRLMRKQAGG